MIPPCAGGSASRLITQTRDETAFGKLRAFRMLRSPTGTSRGIPSLAEEVSDSETSGRESRLASKGGTPFDRLRAFGAIRTP